MFKTEYQIQCRAEFDAMIAARTLGKRCTSMPRWPHTVPVVVVVVQPRLPTLTDLHLAADARMGADYDRLCAETDAKLAEILGLAPRVLRND